MKFAIIALLGLATTQAHRARYAESEGPTKADNGEADNTVLQHQTLGNQDGFKEWKNPLEMHDNGEGDDTVVLQMENGSLIEVNSLWKGYAGRPRRITDEDGDGVEDNVEKTREELDRFEKPAVFGVVEDLHNTHHGNLPGHVRLEEKEEQPAYYDPYGYAHIGFADLKLHI